MVPFARKRHWLDFLRKVHQWECTWCGWDGIYALRGKVPEFGGNGHRCGEDK